MKENFVKFAKLLLVCLLTISSAAIANPSVITSVEAKESGYTIYPNPHEMKYLGGDFIIRPQVNVVYGNKIDDVTKARLEKVLATKNKKVSVTNQKDDKKTNVFVGTYKSNDYVDQYIQKNYKVNDTLLNHNGAYLLAVNNGEIMILGKDTDAAFYGVTSLKHIFSQMDGSTILNLEIRDYADVNIRGFIEGYYGIPWSNEDRMALMEFGGDFKMTSYIFAPKNDPYHKEKWREKYPAKELEKLKEMVKVGNETKCRFVWTAHPFMGGFNRNDYKNEIKRLIDKFEHLYTDAGVRQFGVLGDDVGGLPRSIVIEMMQEVSKWAQSKGDVYDTVFCPGGYNHSWQKDYSELNEYDQGFPKDIQIFWTGEAVCQPIEKRTLDHFRNHNSNHHGQRRAPLFWLNWPVNDINHSRMIMGHGTKMLQTDINVNDLAGAVTNPMQESEPSKVAIFQLADYSWNVKGFNGKKCWQDSFEYIEPNAAEELYTLAKHMSNPEPNSHWLDMPESEELAPKLDAFKEELKKDKIDVTKAKELINEFETIVAACDGLHAKSKNAELKKDLAPFTASLKDLCEANINYIKARLALDSGDKLGAFNFYTAGQNEYKASATHRKPMLGGGTEIVDPGSTRIIPFAKEMEKQLSAPMNEFIAGGEDKVLKITASTNMNSWYQGNITNIIDGKDNTHAWHNDYEQKGHYYQVNFNIPQTVYGVHILNGANQDGKHQDTFRVGQVEYKDSKSGEWKKIGEEFANYPERVDISSIEVKDVVAVRYRCVGIGSDVGRVNTWPSMREFRVSIQPENGTQFTKEVIHTPTHWVLSDAEKAKMIDGNEQTASHFAVRNNTNYGNKKDYTLTDDYVGVKLSVPITLGKIDIVQGLNDNHSDYMVKSKLQYSNDGSHWFDIKGAEFNNKRRVQFDASDLDIKAQYVRLVSLQDQHTWIAVREFDVKEKLFYNAKAYTNVEALAEHKANIFDDNATLAPKDGITLNKNQYIGLKLDRIHEITEIKKVLENENGIKLQVSQNGIEWKEYTSGKVNARYVRLVNTTENPITFNIKELSLKSHEVYPKRFLAADSTFVVKEAESKPTSNLFDGDWTSQVIFGDNQHAGKKFVYDLGQEIDINKLKVVCRDSEHDFPRHAKIEVSTNKQDWKTIMTLGDQNKDNPGEAQNRDEIGYVLPKHETSYNTKEEVLKAPQKARYIKFEITRNKSGDNKWVRFQEFIINDGAYVPTINNPTFESNVMDTANGKFEYLTDNDLSTAYIPAKDTGKLTYHISDNNNVNTIKLVQALNPISNAVVKVRLANQTEFITLGTLSQTVNEFVLPNDTVLADVIIEWEGVTPILKEMVLSKTNYVQVNKTKLESLLAENVNTTSWTKDSKTVYTNAIEAGKKVKDSAKVSQSTIDSAVKAIENAKANHLEKGDIAKLQDALNKAIKDDSHYTVKTWRKYKACIDAIDAAIKNSENTSTKDVEKLLADLAKAQEALVYNPSNMEEATLEVQAENDFIASVQKPESVYTVDSWKAYRASKDAVDALIEQNKNAPVHPTKFKEALDSLRASKDALICVSELVSEIEAFNATNKDLYTEASYNAYKNAVDAAKQLLVNGTQADIAAAVANIKDVKAKLELKDNSSLETLNALIKELKALNKEDYTENSFAQLTTVLTEVSGKDFTNASKQEVQTAINQLLKAKSNLVSVKSLNEMLASANKVNANLYTKVSYAYLQKVMNAVKQVKVNGTTEEVAKALQDLDLAMKNLVVKVDVKAAKDYIQNIQLEDESLYTKESYAPYKAAYDVLVKMLKDLDNVSAKDFNEAKLAFESAANHLVKVDAGSKDEVQTSDQTMVMNYVTLALVGLVGIAAVYLAKKKSKFN